MKFPIGGSIKLFRLEKKITQKELAEKLFISDKTISSYENGHNEPDLSTLHQIANGLGITLTKLIERGELLMKTRKTKFYIDAFDGEFEGYTLGQHWNGWACPFFTKEVGMQVVEEFEKFNDKEGWGKGYKAWYDKEKDAFCFVDPNSTEEDDPEIYEGHDIVFENKTLHVYPIGSFGWVWDEVRELIG